MIWRRPLGLSLHYTRFSALTIQVGAIVSASQRKCGANSGFRNKPYGSSQVRRNSWVRRAAGPAADRVASSTCRYGPATPYRSTNPALLARGFLCLGQTKTPLRGGVLYDHRWVGRLLDFAFLEL